MKRLIAEENTMQCWWLPTSLSCCYREGLYFCDQQTHYIVKRVDTDFVFPLCYKHLPAWAKEGLKGGRKS